MPKHPKTKTPPNVSPTHIPAPLKDAIRAAGERDSAAAAREHELELREREAKEQEQRRRDRALEEAAPDYQLVWDFPQSELGMELRALMQESGLSWLRISDSFHWSAPHERGGVTYDCRTYYWLEMRAGGTLVVRHRRGVMGGDECPLSGLQKLQREIQPMMIAKMAGDIRSDRIAPIALAALAKRRR